MHPLPNRDPVRVLLVEDDDDSAEATRRLLTRFGAEVRVAATAGDALARMQEVRPELVLSDIILPDGNGFELILRLRHEFPELHPYFVATSGVVGVVNGASDELGRFDRFLQKPVEPSALRQLVEDTRERREARPLA